MGSNGNKDDNDLRNADGLLLELQENYSEVFDYIVEKANQKDEDGKFRYYLGVRNNSVILYYLGSKVGEIYISGRSDNRRIHFDIDKYYIGKEKDNLSSFKEFRQAFDDPDMIMKKAYEYAYGHRTDVDITRQKKHYEKIFQQWIINHINSDPASKWFISDMEYTDGVLPKQMRFGRFDLIAVGKEKVEGRYPVILIELKVGHGAFGGGRTTSKNEETRDRIKIAYEKLYSDLYTDPMTIEPVRFGSGLVSHVADYLRYLNYREELYVERLKKEIIISIKTHQKIGVLDKNLFRDIREEELNDIPEVYFLMYTKLPEEIAEGKNTGHEDTLNEIKYYCYHHLYKSKGYSIADNFQHQLDTGFTSDESMERLHETIKRDEENVIVIKQPVKDNTYDFRFVFIDPDDKKTPWDFFGNTGALHGTH